MEASREFSRTPPRLPPCSDVSVFRKTRMSHFWDTHHSVLKIETRRPHVHTLLRGLRRAGASPDTGPVDPRHRRQARRCLPARQWVCRLARRAAAAPLPHAAAAQPPAPAPRRRRRGGPHPRRRPPPPRAVAGRHRRGRSSGVPPRPPTPVWPPRRHGAVGAAATRRGGRGERPPRPWRRRAWGGEGVRLRSGPACRGGPAADAPRPAPVGRPPACGDRPPRGGSRQRRGDGGRVDTAVAVWLSGCLASRGRRTLFVSVSPPAPCSSAGSVCAGGWWRRRRCPRVWCGLPAGATGARPRGRHPCRSGAAAASCGGRRRARRPPSGGQLLEPRASRFALVRPPPLPSRTLDVPVACKCRIGGAASVGQSRRGRKRRRGPLSRARLAAPLRAPFSGRDRRGRRRRPSPLHRRWGVGWRLPPATS